MECDGEVVSYAELNQRANRQAHVLMKRGVGPEALVGLAVPRSAEMVVGVLGVLKAGGAYVPLDPEYPRERLAYMVGDARPALVLATEETAAALPAGTSVLALDGEEARQALAGSSGENPVDGDRGGPLTAWSPAYVIYTSGSTGRPKGVVVEHGALANYVARCREEYPGLAGRTLQHASISFDAVVTVLHAPLAAGGCVHVAALDEELPGRRRGRDRYTFMKMTPSHLPLLGSLPEECAPVGTLMVGGEPVLGEPLREWRRRHPGVELINHYGPT